MSKITYGKQYIDSSDKASLDKTIKSEFLTTGPKVIEFEKKLQKYVGSKYALSCSSGTAALNLAIEALGLSVGSCVIIPTINFISSFNICKKLKFRIYLCDVDRLTGQITPELIKKCIKENNIKKVDLLISMYLGGFPENIEGIYKLKKKFKFKIIEDACHAFGAKYKFNDVYYHVGKCKHSDISTFSFHPIKTITTGEGGLITTNNRNYYLKMKLLRSHGISKSKSHWKYDVLLSGYNYRLSDINCALGLSQLKKINKFLNKRKKIYDFYKKELNNYNNIIKFPNYYKKNNSSYHLAIININFKKKKKNKDKFFKYMLQKKIVLQYHYIPIHTFKVGKKISNKSKIFKNANSYLHNAVSLPIHYNLNYKDLRKVVFCIKKYLK